MPAPLHLEPHLSARQLFRCYRACRDALIARRWHLLWLLASGHSIVEASGLVGLSLRQAWRIVALYNEGGPEGLDLQPRPGRPALLSAKQQALLVKKLEGPSPDGGLWTTSKVARWIEQQTGRPKVSRKVAWSYLRLLGFSLRRGRPQHHLADPEQQQAFKKANSRPPFGRFVVSIPRPRSKSGPWTSIDSA